MNRKLFGVVCLAGFVGVFAHASAANDPQAGETGRWGQNEMPDGIKISLVNDKTNFFLGENILLFYRIENTGSKPFNISVGGDYRGSSRADRFKVTAISATGKQVADPTPVTMNFGGIMPNSEIKLGDVWFENVYVLKYCRFEEPGTYTIHVFHDLGFGKKHDAEPREVFVNIELRAPTEEQARAILVTAENAKPYNGNTWGQKGEARLDYYDIRYPAFLPALIERARNGNQDALAGIASIRTLDATHALVNLLGQTNAAFAMQAATHLEVRLPHSTNEFQGPWGEINRQSFVKNAWDEKLGLPVRDFSLQLLKSTNRSDLLVASSLLKRIGTQHEVPSLLKALEFAVIQTNAEFLADIQYPPPIRVCDALLSTAMTINSNLNVSAGNIQTPGQALLFIAKHSGSERLLTKEDEATFAKLFNHPLAYVRMKALESLPNEIPASSTEIVTKCMTDPNVAVQNYAFAAAKRMQEPQHVEIALAALKSSDDQWLRWAAQDIAMKYGARYKCVMAWASRLRASGDTVDGAAGDAMDRLFRILIGSNAKHLSVSLDVPKNGPDAGALRNRWKEFLIANKDKIEAGYEFQPNELPVENLGLRF